MGMDIYGLKFTESEPAEPTTSFSYDAPEWKDYWEARRKWNEQPGCYFRSNIWYWRPIVMFLQEYADDILDEQDINGISQNSGYTIEGEKYERLKERLRLAVDENYASRWVREFKAKQELLEDEECQCCDGSGFNNGDPCRICDTTGKVQNFMKNYPADIEVLEEFASFVDQSGGFMVW